MSVKHVAQGIFSLLAVFVITLGFPAESPGQKQLFARVEPNLNLIDITAELYDPGTGGFSATASMTTARETATATLLQGGNVLIVGGFNGSFLNTAEVYDPSTRSFGETKGRMASGRRSHSAALLSSGLVLIVGGFNGTFLDSAEIYNPFSSTFAATPGKMTAGRSSHTATLLPNGKVLIAGGINGQALASVEIYDPATGQFTTSSGTLVTGRYNHTATLLQNGKVLIAGGFSDTHLNTAEIYDPATDKFTAVTGKMTASRSGHTATILQNGSILITGGQNGTYLDSAELYDPSSSTFSATTGKMAVPRQGHTASVLQNGRVLIAGGTDGKAVAAKAEIYDPTARTFTAAPGTMTKPRHRHVAAALQSGGVLLAGGENDRPLIFDVNGEPTDNISPSIHFSRESKRGFVGYAGSGVVLVFSAETGEIVKRIETGGKPSAGTMLADQRTLALVSALDNKIFMIDTDSNVLKVTSTYAKATFGFGSIVSISPDGRFGYVSSTGTGEVIKFDASDGKELGRLKGLQEPVQITVTPDGSTLLVVDVGAEELVFADSTALSRKRTLKAPDEVINFTMFNKAVLTLDGTRGILASRDLNESIEPDRVLHFKTDTAEILDTAGIGWEPGFTTITPDGKHWVIFCEFSLFVISTEDFEERYELYTLAGEPLGSANIVFSQDSRFAFYTSAVSDLLFQQDLNSSAVVGRVPLGDFPNLVQDQASSIAFTPDGKVLAALNFMSNNIELLKDVTVLHGPRFISSGSQFTGLSLVNLSPKPAKLEIFALNSQGSLISEDGITNPVEHTLQPNGQLSQLVDQIFGFDYRKDYNGWLAIYSDQPEIVGYASIGRIRPTWFGYFMAQLDGAPLLRETLQDMIVPEVQSTDDKEMELHILNRNYNEARLDLVRFARDGGVLSADSGTSIGPLQLRSTSFSELFPPSAETGKVLIAGGKVTSATIPPAETYNPLSGVFLQTAGKMTTIRESPSATQLTGGDVLVAGGRNSTSITNTAEIYRVETGVFEPTNGVMNWERYRHTATRVRNGLVVLIGGQNSISLNNTAEIYDPSTGVFTEVSGKMISPREAHTATLLPSGRVLIAGGSDGSTIVRTTEIYDPDTGAFQPAANMKTARAFHTATLLPDGRVLIAGGFNGSPVNTAEIYDPASDTFTEAATLMTAARSSHTATLLPDGRVLIAGGSDEKGAVNTAETFEPASGVFNPTVGVMSGARRSHTATLLPDGRVLIVGGFDGSSSLSSAEIFDPSTEIFSNTSNAMSVGRESHTATLLETAAVETGSLRLISQQGVLFTEVFSSRNAAGMLNGIDMTGFRGITRTYAPHIAMVPGFKTILNLLNGNEDDAEITLTLHNPDGSVTIPPLTTTLKSFAQLKNDLAAIFQLEPAMQNRTGWLEIESSVDQVVGTITYTNSEETYLTTVELSGAPSHDFIIPLAAQDSLYSTGLALLNSNTDAASVTIELWGPSGTLDRSTVINLDGGKYFALYLNNIFPNLQPTLVGNVRIRSSRPLHGIAILSDRDMNFLSAIPLIPFPNGGN